MKKNLILIFFGCILSFGQSRKGQFNIQNSSHSHSLYICFAKDADIEHIVNQSVNISPQLHRFIKDNGVSFVYNLNFSDQKLNEMLSASRKNNFSGESVQKLKRIYKVQVSTTNNEDILKLAGEFEKFKEVEYASIISNQPIEPPFIKNAFTITPDLESQQTYLMPNPGINVAYAWSRGITGSHVRVRDIEYGFHKSHEMLADRNMIQMENVTLPDQLTNLSSPYNRFLDHGTAVMSIMGSAKDNIGLSGAAYNASEMIGFPEWTTTSDRIGGVSRAISASQAGDIILYEMQTDGQDFSYVPAEYENIIWDLTKAATDSGIIIIAAAGNGGENLDDPYHSSYLSRGNSGAIIVGAGTITTEHSRLTFSTYGSRIDVQGWGHGVLAAGYGQWQEYDGDRNRRYVLFSGTSSATPIVASAAILIQSYYFQRTGGYMSPAALKNLLITTGIPQGGDISTKIGPLPNVKAAIEYLDANTTLSIKENATKPLSIEIFPNPASDYLFVRNNEKSSINFEIISMTGQTLLKGSVSSDEKINISQLSKGVYFLNATDGTRRVIEKFTKL